MLIADSTAGAETNLMAVDDEKGVAAHKTTDQGQDIVLDVQGGGASSLAGSD